jgi:hypothetical protein
MANTQFDPDKGPLFQGRFTEVTVLDPAIPGHEPNLVLDRTKPFEVRVTWRLKGSDVNLYLAALEPEFSIACYAESIGPGPEVILAEETEPTANSTVVGPQELEWTHTLSVPADVLEEENPGPAGPSGTYRLVSTVFLNSAVPGGYDIAGFSDGPMIKVENPE